VLIAIEGADGAGKATQSKLLADRITRHNITAHVFSFPRYDTPIGRAIKRHLVQETMLAEAAPVMRSLSGYVSDREPLRASMRRAPEDALMFQCLALADKYDAANDMREIFSRGEHVVCDRWIPSSFCYGTSDGLDPTWLKRMHSSLPQADLNIFIDISPEETLRRRPEVRDRYEQDREKQKVVRVKYQELWAKGAFPTWQVVSGEGSIDEVADRIWKAFSRVVLREMRGAG
jgi:dTMP kinase